MGAKPIVSISFTWRTSPEHHNCPTCARLDGYTWVLELGEGLPATLDFEGLPVWAVDSSGGHSIVHDHVGIDWECYCSLEGGEINEKDLELELRMLTTAAEAALHMLEAEMAKISVSSGA